MSENHMQQLAYNLVAYTNCSFFLTGKAGTGKTTFLRRIQQEIAKRFLVLAPTGIAALMAGGETIHSFFGMPLEVLTRNSVFRINSDKQELIRMVDTLIIDEVSMVRCDVVDAINRILCSVMSSNLPFGGKQVIFVGDLFQLEPVVRRSDRTATEMLRDIYGTENPFFFKAHVFKRLRLLSIEFEHVYRQRDEQFLEVLNQVRRGSVGADGLSLLNKCVGKRFKDEEMTITLTSHNNTADEINQQHLAAIAHPTFVYEGVIDKQFRLKELPAPSKLELKVGCQVMFCRNDVCRRWVNGTIGVVSALEENRIVVRLEDGNEYEVGKVIWESYEQKYHKHNGNLEKKLVGTYTQYPLKLAWAITIHKSQGMTFNKMYLDLSRGVFLPGQLYVALSRVTSLEGLSLSKAVSTSHVMQNMEVNDFAATFNDYSNIDKELEEGKLLYPFLCLHDYDGAAATCLDMVREKASKGDIRGAALMAKKMFDVMVDDSLLLGLATHSDRVNGESASCIFLNAVFCLYSGAYEDAANLANDLLSKRATCKEAMYIRSRALGALGQWKRADKCNEQLLEAYKGTDENYDGKTLMWVAATNEAVGDAALGLYQMLVNRYPDYIKPLCKLRHYMKGKNVCVESKDENVLAEAFDDASVSDDEFVALYQKEGNEEAASALKEKLLNLAFE